MIFVWFTAAFATPSFPAVVADELGMPCTPSCLLCHSTAAGGGGTATQEFAISMLAAGLVEGDDASVAPALAELESAGSDLDGDGRGDVAELSAGANPNPDGVDFCSVPTAEYGCFPSASSGVWVGVLGVVAWRKARARP